MRYLVRHLAILGLLAGCTNDPDDPPFCRTAAAGVVPCSPPEPDPDVRVTWSYFTMLGGPELVGACPPDVASVELHTSANTMVSLPCTIRSGEITVPFGHRLLVRLVDAAGATVAESPPEDPQGRIQVRATFYEDAGYARTQWRVHDAGLGEPPPSRCFSTSDPLRLVVTDASGTQILSRAYACPQQGTFQLLSDPIREGTYTFTFTGLADSTTVTVPIGRNNAVTDLDVTTH